MWPPVRWAAYESRGWGASDVWPPVRGAANIGKQASAGDVWPPVHGAANGSGFGSGSAGGAQPFNMNAARTLAAFLRASLRESSDDEVFQGVGALT